jgi:ketosteroid isomerase-like protein
MTEVTHEQVADWVTAYRVAWESNEPDDIRGLFTADAVYLTEPYAKPWEGQDAIVEGWLESADEPGTTEFDWSIVAVEGDIAVVRAVTPYRGRATYHNVWVIKFAEDGSASEFTEWWMAEKPV